MNIGNNSPMLVGLTDICAYLKRSKPTVRRMIRNKEIPVTLKCGAYMTTTLRLNAWIEEETKTNCNGDCTN